MVHTHPSTLPTIPGVYLFKAADGTILYIGKAKNLRARVRTYFAAVKIDWKVQALVEEHDHISHIPTTTEHQALVLEAQLIQQYQPKYNRLLKEGQPFVYIAYNSNAKLPTFKVVRNKKDKGVYFGPFIHKMPARKAVDFLIDTFGLRTCNKKMDNGCLYYHIKKCAGTCLPNFNADEYRMRSQLALHVLRNQRKTFIKTIQDGIAACSKAMQFERAQHLHNYLEHIDRIFGALQHHLAPTNYAHDVARTVATPRTQSAGDDTLATELQNLVGYATPIRTIDCFDISHFQSTHIVGSCVRFTDGKPDKNMFRRFKIKTLSQQNDYAALQEIVERRYKHESELPDLIIIDGGIGQRNAVKHLVPQEQLASLAKREERLHTFTHPKGIVLNAHNSAAQTIIALRDYAHHFAISYHRLRGQS